MNALADTAAKMQAVGLAQNPAGVTFHCGSCEYFKRGKCGNPNPKLNGRRVDPVWCCDLYEHAGMKVIVK